LEQAVRITMIRYTLDKSDQELLHEAGLLIASRGREPWHAVAALLRTKSGAIYRGLHLEANVGRVAVCAEAVALANAAMAGDTEITTVVAIYKSGQVVSPCGMCRELLTDYAPAARAIVSAGDELFKVALADLLPFKYHREF